MIYVFGDASKALTTARASSLSRGDSGAFCDRRGKWLKAAKRMRSAVIQEKGCRREQSSWRSNSPAGQAGQIDGDLAVSRESVSVRGLAHPLGKVKAELDMVKYRASGVYGLAARKESMIASVV